MNADELNSIYYAVMCATLGGQSTHAVRLWRLAEREREQNNYLESDSSFRNNRSIAFQRMIPLLKPV